MIYNYKGHYSYDDATISNWNSNVIGVYYCGFKISQDTMRICYIGRAVGEGGIKGRLLQHLQENKWHDVTHFGYYVCDTVNEAIDFETREIAKHIPKYNTQGV